MEHLLSLSKDEQEAYLDQQSCEKLLELFDKCLNFEGSLLSLIISVFFSKVDQTDPLFPQGLLSSGKAFFRTQPLQSLSQLQVCSNIAPSFNDQVYPIVKQILLENKTEEFLQILEKFIEQSAGLWQIKYLKLMAEFQSGNSIEIYQNIWNAIYELNIPAEQINEILEVHNELTPDPLHSLTPSGKPKLVYKSKFLETWWVCDTSETKAFVYLGLLLNDLRSTLQKSVTADLMAIILTLGLSNKHGLKLAQAGMQVSVEPLDNCLEIKISGHASRVLDASEQIMEYIYDCCPTDETFEAALSLLKQQYYSMTSDPTNQSRQLRLAFLQHQQYLYPEKLRYLGNSTYNDLNFANVKVLLLACGHVSESQTSDLAEFIEGLLFAAEGHKLKYLSPRTVTLIPEQIIELVQNPIVPTNNESVVEVYFQFGQASVEERVLTTLVEMIVYDSITEELARLNCKKSEIAISSRMTRGVSGLLIKVVAIETHPDVVQEVIFEYMEKLRGLVLETFDEKKRNLMEIKQQGFRNLGDKGAFFWEEVLQGNLEFERDVKEIEFLRGLAVDVLVEWLEKQKVVSKALVVKIVDFKWGVVRHKFTEEFSLDVETVRNKLPCYSWLRIMH